MPRPERDGSEMAQSHVPEIMVKVVFTYVAAPISRVRSGTNGMTPSRRIGLIP